MVRLDGQYAGGSCQVVGVVDQGGGALRSMLQFRVGLFCLKPDVVSQTCLHEPVRRGRVVNCVTGPLCCPQAKRSGDSTES